MNNEKHFYLTPLLFEQDVDLIVDAILQAQNNWGDKRNGTLAWDTFVQSRIDELVPAGLPKSYDDLRVKRNTVEYPDIYTEEVDLASIHRCIEIGDQLLAIAQSISS